LQLLLFSSTTMPPKRIADDGAPKARKPQAPKERPPGMTNSAWAADVERRQTETRGRAEREKKLAAKRAAAADEQARLVSMAMGQPRIGQFPAGSWPTQGTIGSPSTYSPAASSPMFADVTYVPAISRFTPSTITGSEMEPKTSTKKKRSRPRSMRMTTCLSRHRWRREEEE
jgi:hypothetical protein